VGDGSAPRCPSWLSPAGKSEWKAICPILREMKVLSASDRTTLALLCDQLAYYRQSAETRDVTLASKLLPGIIKLCDRFGLSPSARASLTIAPVKEQEEDPKLRFFKGGGTG